MQVDEAAWRDFQKLREQLDQHKRDMLALTTAFVEYRAQAAADTLVCPTPPPLPPFARAIASAIASAIAPAIVSAIAPVLPLHLS